MKHTVFSLSVDDGHPLDMRLAELLHKRGIPASFHVPIRNSEGSPVLIASQMRELAENFDVGCHRATVEWDGGLFVELYHTDR